VGSCLVDPEIGKAGDYDTAAITLKTASGRIAQITNTRRATYGYDQRAEVHGSKGMLRIDNPISTTVQLANASGYSTDPLMDFFMQRYADAYRAEITLFVETLKSGAVFSPSIADGLAAQRIADAATQSAQTGLPVKL
jgi:myo-inositol 2-dehydrogenase/D-chiro-inositol 1-dehydrogenase